MHVVYLVSNLSHISGGTRVIIDHVNGLAKRGHAVELWQTDATAQPYFACEVPIKPYTKQLLSKPDVIVMTDPAFIPDVTLSGRKKGQTFLLLQHDFEWLAHATGTDIYANWFTANKAYFQTGQCEVLVVGSWLQKTFKERYGVDSHVIRNGVDKTIFHPAEPLQKHNEPVALVVYDPQPWKGFEEAVGALLQIKHPDLKIAMVGRSYPLTPIYDGQPYGFSFPSIYFCRPDQADLASIYSMATVFVSTSWKEGFGLPGLEALACGVPLVTTDSGGPRDYAIDGETALVIPPQNPGALVEAITKILVDTALRQKLAKNGLTKAAEFDWDKSLTELESVLNKILIDG